VAAFVGFAPLDHPKMVILVMIDEPKGVYYGGIVAGPVFRDVGAWTLNTLHVNPDIRIAALETKLGPGLYKRPEVRLWPKATKGHINTVPDFGGLGMREVLNLGRSMGLEVLLEGTGFAYKQVPGPGSLMEGITSVKVSFRPPAS
jgi:cell division protein FtsI (penicillin-binding protein 3)